MLAYNPLRFLRRGLYVKHCASITWRPPIFALKVHLAIPTCAFPAILISYRPVPFLCPNRASRLEAQIRPPGSDFVLHPTADNPPQAHFRPPMCKTVLQVLKHGGDKNACNRHEGRDKWPSSRRPSPTVFCIITSLPRKKPAKAKQKKSDAGRICQRLFWVWAVLDSNQ